MQRNIGRTVRIIGLATLAIAPAAACPRHATDAPDMRARLLRSAITDYRYEPERLPMGTQPKGVPLLRIASARINSGVGTYPGSHFVGYVIAPGRGYWRLGIAPGKNYLWTDSIMAWASDSGPSRVLVVPENRSYPMVWLKVDSIHPPRRGMGAPGRSSPPGDDIFHLTSTSARTLQEISAGPDPLLRYVSDGIEACTDGCPTGHCANSTGWRAYDPITDDATMHIP